MPLRLTASRGDTRTPMSTAEARRARNKAQDDEDAAQLKLGPGEWPPLALVESSAHRTRMRRFQSSRTMSQDRSRSVRSRFCSAGGRTSRPTTRELRLHAGVCRTLGGGQGWSKACHYEAGGSDFDRTWAVGASRSSGEQRGMSGWRTRRSCALDSVLTPPPLPCPSPSVYKKTLDYVEVFSRFHDSEVAQEVRKYVALAPSARAGC